MAYYKNNVTNKKSVKIYFAAAAYTYRITQSKRFKRSNFDELLGKVLLVVQSTRPLPNTLCRSTTLYTIQTDPAH